LAELVRGLAAVDQITERAFCAAIASLTDRRSHCRIVLRDDGAAAGANIAPA
jgi:hypothetical protein